MLATIQPAAEVASPVPPVAAAPSVVPVRLWDGDRMDVRTSRHGLTWKREGGMWHPFSSGRPIGSPVEDFVIREYLERVKSSDEARYAPRSFGTTEALPGRPVMDRTDLDTLLGMGMGAEGAIPCVASSGICRGFWSLRDLVAEQGGEDAAAYINPVVSLEQMRDALAVMLEEPHAEVSFHRPAGRLYARYQTYGAYEQGEQERIQVRTYVYVLTGRR
ncbi:hypothetical protein AB0H51_27905 [Streptomyces griseoluteus]|uniref:hypothetical protein n=1 Tax=Streptomyces griseoluteus TaxID=29306 RepID=UPI0033CDE41E